MIHWARSVATTAPATLCIWLLAGCGSYDNTSKGSGTGGSVATGGTSAPTGGKATGGSSVGGTGGTASTTGGSGTTGGSSTTGGAGTTGGSSGGMGGGASGGSNEPVTCADAAAAPCGGDLVGTWKALSCETTVSGMADMVPTGLGCTSAPVTGSLKVSGTWTGEADGKFKDVTMTVGEAVLELAKACLTISGFGTTCDRINLEPLGLTTIVCVDNAATEGCTCTATINQPGGLGRISVDSAFNLPEGTPGTYKTADDKLTTTVAGADSEYSYCVSGNALTVNLVTPTPVGTLTGPMVLQKQ